MTGTPPGWYPDPGGPPGSRVRWWDGNAWTTHVNATLAPLAPQAVLDLEAERGDADRARKALVFGAALYAVQFLLVAVVYHAVVHNFFHQVSPAQNGTTSTLSPAYTIGSLTLNLISLGLLAVGILFLVWVHRAATLARRAGLPARHSPGMAVGGFFIPILNFWFPYQATVDMFPPTHPDRSVVLRWWLLWLGTQFSAAIIGIASFVSLGLGLVLALGGIVLAVNAAIAARQVIRAVEQTHGELVAGMVTPPA